MNSNRLINIRVSKRQYEMIKNRMDYMGYRSMSQFVRDCTLRDDLATLILLKDIHSKIMKKQPDGNIVDNVKNM